MEPTVVKEWYRSKTFWVNALTLAGSIIAAVTASEFVRDNPQLVLVLTGLVIPIINVILRWLTDEPINSILPMFDRFRHVEPNLVRSRRRIHVGKVQNHNLRTKS